MIKKSPPSSLHCNLQGGHWPRETVSCQCHPMSSHFIRCHQMSSHVITFHQMMTCHHAFQNCWHHMQPDNSNDRKSPPPKAFIDRACTHHMQMDGPYILNWMMKLYYALNHNRRGGWNKQRCFTLSAEEIHKAPCSTCGDKEAQADVKAHT